MEHTNSIPMENKVIIFIASFGGMMLQIFLGSIGFALFMAFSCGLLGAAGQQFWKWFHKKFLKRDD